MPAEWHEASQRFLSLCEIATTVQVNKLLIGAFSRGLHGYQRNVLRFIRTLYVHEDLVGFSNDMTLVRAVLMVTGYQYQIFSIVQSMFTTLRPLHVAVNMHWRQYRIAMSIVHAG